MQEFIYVMSQEDSSMSKVNIFFAEGFEEVEALTAVDLLRRAGVEVSMVSITGSLLVKGARGITVEMNELFENVSEADCYVLPGGMPGTKYLKEHKGLSELIFKVKEEGKLLGAICAAPTVYGEMGLLNGVAATCYPGMEDMLKGAKVSYDSVVSDGQFVTSRGVGTAIDFALKLIERLCNKEVADKIADSIVYSA